MSLSWELDEFNEVDLTRIKELQIRELITNRNEKSALSQKAGKLFPKYFGRTGSRIQLICLTACLKCPQFIKHVSPAAPRREVNFQLALTLYSSPCVMINGL